MPGPGRVRGSADPRRRTGTDAGATGGRSKCMSGRQLARTGARRRQRQPLGHAASRKVHSRAERRRRSASEARFSSTIFGVGLGHCPCAAKAACGLPACQTHAGAAGAVKRPVVPHAPTGEEGTRRPASPGAGREHGAMTRVCRSPDEAQRNPGCLVASQLPDFAALHPGYEERAGCLTIE